MQTVPGSASGTDAAEAVIRAHYDDFNARRLDAAAARFHPDARIEHITGQVESGPDGFRLLARQWVTAFPDVQVAVQSIRSLGSGMYDAEMMAEGTHTGTLTFGSWEFRASHVLVRIPARELFHIEEGRFRLASLSFDLQDLVRQLGAVDVARLLEYIARIHQLGQQLAAENEPARQRELIEGVGRQLDAARNVVRPYFRTNK